MDSYYFVLVVWCVFESFLCTCVVFGWAQLLEILENERYFSSYCGAEYFSNNTVPQLNISNSLENEEGSHIINTCSKQDNLLRLAYTLSVFGCFATIFVSGKYLDVFGFRKTRILACLIYVVAGVMMFISTYDFHELLFPGLILTAASGSCYISVLVKVCGVLPQRRYIAMSVINGGTDSSAIVFLIFKLCYNAGISFKFIIIVYYSIAVGQGLLFTFTIFPKDLPGKSREKDFGNGSSNEKHSTSYDTSRDSLKPNINGRSKLEKVSTEPEETKKDALDIIQIEENGCKLYTTRESSSAGKITFLEITRSPKFLVHTGFVSISSLRSFTFIAIINTLLKRLTDDVETVDSYLTILGIIQFSGIIIGFLPGFLLDWYPTGKHGSFSTILSFIVTGIISIFVTVGMLIPVLELQIVVFVLYAALRSFLYSTHGTFIMKEFPLRHVGALYGLSLLISAVVSLFQIPMFVLMEGPYNGDPNWVNVGLLVFQILVMIHPIYLWKCTKHEDKSSRNSWLTAHDEQIETIFTNRETKD